MNEGLASASAALAQFTANLNAASKVPLPSGGTGQTVPGAGK
jgi:hypothetical protein